MEGKKRGNTEKIFVTVNLSAHLGCKYSSFTAWTNDSTTSKLVVSSHSCVSHPPSPVHPSSAGLGCGLPKTHSCIHQDAPAALQAWQHAALFVSPSFPLFLPSALCLFDFSLFWWFPSIISLLACHCLSFFMCIYRDFHPFLSPYFHHPLPSVQCYPAPSLILPSCN